MNSGAAAPDIATEPESGHPGTLSLYVAFALLMFLLLATLASAMLLHGSVGTAMSLGISVAKTILIAAIFMNLRGSTALIRLAAVAAILWLTLALLFMMSDYTTRGWNETGDETMQQAISIEAYDRVHFQPDPPAQK